MMNRHRWCQLSCVFVGLLITTVLLGSRLPSVGAEEQRLMRIDVTIGKSQVLTVKEPFNRVSLTNPNIADVFVITPNQILLNGKSVGVTSLVVFYPQKTMFFDLVVQTDIALLQERLKQIAPREQIEVYPAQDALILKGDVSSDHTITSARDVASVFALKGKVVNLLSLKEVQPQQVLLQVQVAEVARIALREFGVSMRALGSTLQGAAFAGRAFFTPLGALGAVTQSGFQESVVGRSTPNFAFSDLLGGGGNGFFLSSGARDVAGLVQALAERDLLRTLAKPTLVTHSGKEAKFISGGEFPFPVAQSLDKVTVEFKEFGVGLVFRPLVVEGGDQIELTVRPEVSSLDFSRALQLPSGVIPNLKKNQASTTVTVRDGESFVMGGLINNEVRQVVAKIPVLGDIPILGALFRSTRFRNNESELVFIVTVKLVKPLPPAAAVVPDVTRMLELRPQEKEEFTLVPGIPGVGEVVERPLGTSNLLRPGEESR